MIREELLQIQKKDLLKMSLAMDRALMALSLDEEDTPIEMPDLPGFTSAEENKLSLMGEF